MNTLNKKEIKIIKNLKTIKGGVTWLFYSCHLSRLKAENKNIEIEPSINIKLLIPHKEEYKTKGPGLFSQLPPLNK